MEWNKIDVNIRSSASCNVLKRGILKFIRPESNQVCEVDRSEGLKFLARIRFGSNRLSDYKFMHNFQDCINPICTFGQEIETSTDFFFHCSNYHCE